MSLSDYNQQLLGRLRASVREFVAGGLTIGQIQSVLESVSVLLENDGSGVADAVRLAEADVEEIRFTLLLDEQYPAAISRLEELSAVGRIIVGLRRIFCVVHEKVDTTVGPLEVNFSDGTHLLMDAGADGGALRVISEAWEDSFAEENMTPENREFVARSERWTAFDVSQDSEYVRMIGAMVANAEPIRTSTGRTIGVIIRTSSGDLRVKVESDNLHVCASW
jgi:hypothetical protein